MPEANHDAECAEQERLFAELTRSLRNVVEIQSSQIAALKLGERDTSTFDEEIRIALGAWHKARHVYMQHILDHGCCSGDDLN